MPVSPQQLKDGKQVPTFLKRSAAQSSAAERSVTHHEGGLCLEPILREACSQAYPVSAICVQRFDDSLSSAIRITYRISLRSSSLREPRYPLLRVVFLFRMCFSPEGSKAV